MGDSETGDDMTDTRVPAGWTMTTGTWGTDANRENSVVATGKFALRLDDTATATIMDGPYIAMSPDIPLSVGAYVRTDDVTAGHNVGTNFTDYDGNYVQGNQWQWDDELSAADTWQWTGANHVPASDAVWARFQVFKTTNAHNIYYDQMFVERHPPGWFRYHSGAAQSVSSSTWTTLDFDARADDPIGQSIPEVQCSWDSGNDQIVIGPPGVYTIHSIIEFPTISDGTIVDIRLKTVSANALFGQTRYRYGQRLAAAGSQTVRIGVTTVADWYDSGDTIEVQVWHNEGSPISIPAGDDTDDTMSFQGTRFGKL